MMITVISPSVIDSYGNPGILSKNEGSGSITVVVVNMFAREVHKFIYLVY
jgi:hypothetical protein